MRWFSLTEFDCKCGKCDCTGEKMSATLLSMVDDARDIAGIPFSITSGMRCQAHNEREGGSPTSSHLAGHAVDIACSSGSQRYQIVEALRLAGFNRIGLARTFVHADADPGKPGGVIWLY